MRIVCEISIAAPHTVVWTLIANDEARKLWVPELVATTYPSGRPRSDPTGTRFRATIRDGPSIRCFVGEVAAHVEGRLRAIRLADRYPDLFRTQVRAILRASERIGRSASIMAPCRRPGTGRWFRTTC